MNLLRERLSLRQNMLSTLTMSIQSEQDILNTSVILELQYLKFKQFDQIFINIH